MLNVNQTNFSGNAIFVQGSEEKKIIIGKVIITNDKRIGKVKEGHFFVSEKYCCGKGGFNAVGEFYEQ